MKTKDIDITLDVLGYEKSFSVSVSYTYNEGCKGTKTDPAEPACIEIFAVNLIIDKKTTVDLEPALSRLQIEALEEEILLYEQDV